MTPAQQSEDDPIKAGLDQILADMTKLATVSMVALAEVKRLRTELGLIAAQHSGKRVSGDRADLLAAAAARALQENPFRDNLVE